MNDNLKLVNDWVIKRIKICKEVVDGTVKVAGEDGQYYCEEQLKIAEEIKRLVDKETNKVKECLELKKEKHRLTFKIEQLEEENKRLYEALHADNVALNVLYSMPDPHKLYEENLKLKDELKVWEVVKPRLKITGAFVEMRFITKDHPGYRVIENYFKGV